MNHFLKRAAALALACVMALTVTACSGNAPASSAAPESSSSAAPASSAVESAPESQAPALSVTDHLGRTVTLEKSPEKIVSGYYITSSLLIALGLTDKTVGIEAKAKSRPIYALAAPGMLDLPNVGTAKEFDLEGCLALKPDLVILPVKLKDSVEALEKAGVNVIAVNPESDKELRETIEMVGTLTGTKDRADKLLKYYDDQLSDVKTKLSTTNQPKVYLAGNSDMLSTATSKMYQDGLITNAGGVNVAGEIDDSYWATVSYEQLIAWNPDVIIIVPGASYSKEDVLNDAKLKDITAVKDGDVYQMPDSFEAWDSPVPSGILGTMWMAGVLHDNFYSFEEFQKEAAAFYGEFYGVEIDTALITK